MTTDRQIDLGRIKRNVATMAAQNAPVEDIDGYIASEGVTIDQIRSYTPAQAAQPEPAPQPKLTSVGPIDDTTPDVAEQPGRFARIGQEFVGGLGEAVGTGRAIKEDIASGRIGPIRGMAQALPAVGFRAGVVEPMIAGLGIAYQTAKTVGDILPAAYASAKTGVPFKEVYGEALEEPGPLARGTGAAIGATLGPPIAGARQFLEEKYVKGDPTRARDVEAGGFGLEALVSAIPGGRQVAGAVKAGPKVPFKPTPETARPGVMGKAADIIRMGETRDRAVLDMALPTGKKYETAAAARGKEVSGVGPLKTYTKKLTPWEKDYTNELVTTKGINPNNTVQDNINVINKVVEVENKKIVAALKDNFQGINNTQLSKNIDVAIEKAFGDDLLLKGTTTAQSNIQLVKDTWATVMAKHPNNAHGLYMARREMDNIMEANYKNIWDNEAALNSMKIINRGLRDGVKNSIEAIAPGKGFSQSMERQSRLLYARGNMAGKAAKELETPMARFDKRKKELGRMNLAGATAAAAQDVAGVATKGALAPVLNTLDSMIKVASPERTRILKAYRLGIIEAARDLPEVE